MKKLAVILAMLGLLAAGCSKQHPQTTNRDGVMVKPAAVVAILR